MISNDLLLLFLIWIVSLGFGLGLKNTTAKLFRVSSAVIGIFAGLLLTNEADFIGYTGYVFIMLNLGLVYESLASKD